MTPAWIGFIRGLGTIILMVVLSYIGDAAHLHGLVNASMATIISGLALALEHSMEASTGRALLGAVKRKY